MPKINRTGFTLLELLIALVLTTLLMGAVWAVYDVGFRTFYTEWTRTGVKGQAARALFNMGRELRIAGQVLTSSNKTLSFSADADLDGADETITYSWSGTIGDPLLRTSAASTTNFIDSVENLVFSYYDSDNNPTTTASQVRLVNIDVTITDKDETFELRSNEKLRNL